MKRNILKTPDTPYVSNNAIYIQENSQNSQYWQTCSSLFYSNEENQIVF